MIPDFSAVLPALVADLVRLYSYHNQKISNSKVVQLSYEDMNDCYSRILIFLLIILITALSSNCQCPYDALYSKQCNKCYRLQSEMKDWLGAEVVCQRQYPSDDGHLASIGNTLEDIVCDE